MNKMGLAVIILLSCISASFAQSSAPAVAVKAAPVAMKMFTGKVAALAAADAAKGVKASVSVVNENGEKVDFLITPATVIKDAAEKAVALGALVNGAVVKVACIAKDGGYQAATIKVEK